MKPILQNLVEMTGHRDHFRLEVSVLSTLQKLNGIIEVRALELFTDAGVPHVLAYFFGELVVKTADTLATAGIVAVSYMVLNKNTLAKG